MGGIFTIRDAIELIKDIAGQTTFYVVEYKD